ncbi:MAG: tRNA N6-adenosine threonylcarbamoyltransferase, mitochondrial [Chlamydiales bacterium]|nr:tRNA N6-adenosine threonylcarbamoyltransferase, mitochondrial [Chlamydiales bacterium]MCH9635453.1 tRNA N6-adenosine threonylcarbamoyltransferase, mitochondrial [Chlamydiales bacterium]
MVIVKMADGSIQKKSLPSGYQSSKYLIESLNIDFQDVSLIGVTVGPGLMTGIRVGMAAAQGLSLGLGVPLVGISSFAGYLGEGSAAVIDAKVRGAHIQEYGQKPRLVDLEDLGQFERIVGPNLSRVDHPQKVEVEPCPEKMIAAVLAKFMARDFSVSAIYS